MKELVILIMFLGASLSDIRNRTIPNRIPAFLVLYWLSSVASSEDRFPMVIRALESEFFILVALGVVGIVTKFMGHVSFMGGGDIKLILAACLYLELKETFVFLFSANILGVMFSLMFILWNKFSSRKINKEQRKTSLNDIFCFTIPLAPFLTFGVALALFLR